MDELLILTHRIPYPPDKGDKIRAWNFFRYLAARYDVYLGTFVDENRDWRFTSQLRDLCKDSYFARLNPTLARLRSLQGFINGTALTLPYYFDPGLDGWVRTILERPQLRRIFVYCSAMVQYVSPEGMQNRRCVVDLVDVDSEKWLEYARRKRALSARVFKREGVKLRHLECEIASSAQATVVSTKAEEVLLRSFLLDKGRRITCICNGVDAEYFSPERPYARPPEIQGTSLVFTGAMDYWPNVDAVTHFAKKVFPHVKRQIPDASLLVVGSNPDPAVRELAGRPGILVTGRVPDVRPYIAHSTAVIAPLRVARGVQNKVLEGMAMGRPVIASREAANGIDAQSGKELLVVPEDDPLAFAEAVQAVGCSQLGLTLGQSAREYILQQHDWSKSAHTLQLAIERE